MSTSQFVKRDELPNVSKFVRNDKIDQSVLSPFSIGGTNPILNLVDTNGEDLAISVDADAAAINFGGVNHINLRGAANDDIQMQRKTTFDDDVIITDDHLQINTSAGLDANNRLVVNHNESPQTSTAVSFRAGATNVCPLDVVSEASATHPIFRGLEDNDATERFRISSDGKFETRAGNGATPSTSFISLMGLYKTIFSTAGNSTTVETDLHTRTLEANVLGEDGDMLDVTFAGTFAANANTKTWRVYFGGTQIAGGSTSLYNNLSWIIHVRIIRISSSTVKCITHQEVNSNVVNSIVSYISVGSLSFSGTLILKVTGQSAADAVGTGTNDVVQEMSIILKGSNQ